jgi:phosphatidylethanolamine-binding protein (PEBP) family uncharacterized protein
LALLLSGCGGGSSEPGSASTSPDAAAAAGQGGGGSSAAAGSAAAKAKQAKAQSPTPGAPAGTEGPSGPGQKHGERIVPPKGAPEQAPTPSEVAHATVADMTLQSPAILASEGNPGSLAPTYTCDGKGSWPALSWQGVPPGTAELALFVMNVQPVDEQLFVDWAVAGLDPGLEGIKAGELPKGAIVGTNGFGKADYEICPSGQGEIYMFALYALPRRLSPKRGFDARELRKEVLAVSGDVGLLPALYAHS